MPYQISFTDLLTRGTYGLFVFSLIILSFLLVIFWIFLPFAIFKIKSILNETNSQLMQISENLAKIQDLLKEQAETTRAKREESDAPASRERSPQARLKDENNEPAPLTKEDDTI